MSSSNAVRRIVFVTDQMQDVRMIEGLATVFDLTVLAPGYLRTKFSTWPTSGNRYSKQIFRGGRSLFVFKAAWWLLMKRGSYDVVVAQDNLTAALAANVAALLTRKPVVLRLGRTTEEYYRCRRVSGSAGPSYWLGLAVVKVLVSFNERRAAAIGASSNHIAKSTRGRCARVEVIPAYGVDLERFSPKVTRTDARRKLDLPAEVPLVLCRSRIAPEKDPETFLEAMSILKDQGIKVTGLYVGGEFEEFLKLVRVFDVDIIARNAVHPDDLALYYRAADMLVQTSRAEGLGISPIEALACEVPVIVSATGGLTETIVNGQTGVVVAPGDASATAMAIRWVLEHPDEAHAMAVTGRAMVSNRYTAARAFSAWEHLVQDLLAF